MTNIIEARINQATQLHEFPLEIPTGDEIVGVTKAFIENRERLRYREEEFGLRPGSTTRRNNQAVSVGPFIYPTPFSTTFAGNPDNLRAATSIGSEIAATLSEYGYTAIQYSMLLLALSGIPLTTNKDCLILPRNADSNQKVPLVSKSEQGNAYGFVRLRQDDYSRVQALIASSFNTYKDRSPLMRSVGKTRGRAVLSTIQSDFDEAWKLFGEESISYLDFAKAYNTRLAQRAIYDFDLPVSLVDTGLYSPFLTEDVEDIEVFTARLLEAGIIETNTNILKIIDERQRSQMLRLVNRLQSDLLLQSEDKKTVRFSELTDSQASIAPSKELSYVLCFSSMLPVVYGDINNDPYYSPYAIARQQG